MKIICILISLILSITSYAQSDSEKHTSEIEDVEVEIIKDREIVLLKANRNFEKIIPTFTPTDPPKLKYQFEEFNFEIPDLTFKLQPLRIKKEQLQKLYGGYVKAGFGNFKTPYLEGYINNKRNQQYAYGFHAKHLASKNGPVDDENSGTSENKVDAFGKVFTKKATLGGRLGYEQDKVHFYGYPDGTVVSIDTIKQQFSKIDANGFIKSNNSANDISYYLGVGYQHLSDMFSAKEGIFTSKFDLAYFTKDKNKMKLAANINLINRTDITISDNRVLVTLQPTYEFVYNDVKLETGFNASYENDTLQNLGKLHLYPILKAKYNISNQVELYAMLDGGIIANTYQRVIDKTPFLSADVPIYHSNKLYELSGGIRSKIGKNSYANIGFSIADYAQYQFLINNPSDYSQFILEYDAIAMTTNIVNIFGEWGLIKSSKLEFSIRGDYFLYNTALEVWHQPQFKITAFGRYNIYNKIIFETSLYSIGGIKVFDASSNGPIKLDTAIDIGVKGTYLLSDQFLIFAKFNNILSQEYQLLYRYPVKGAQFMGGIGYTF